MRALTLQVATKDLVIDLIYGLYFYGCNLYSADRAKAVPVFSERADRSIRGSWYTAGMHLPKSQAGAKIFQ